MNDGMTPELRKRYVDISAVLVHGDMFDLREVIAVLRLDINAVREQRDGARALVVSMTSQDEASRAANSQVIRALAMELAAASREADRLRHGVPIEGDFACPNSLKLDAAMRVVKAARIVLESGETGDFAALATALAEMPSDEAAQ